MASSTLARKVICSPASTRLFQASPVRLASSVFRVRNRFSVFSSWGGSLVSLITMSSRLRGPLALARMAYCPRRVNAAMFTWGMKVPGCGQ